MFAKKSFVFVLLLPFYLLCFESPRLNMLEQEIAQKGMVALEQFQKEMASVGTPLVEEIPGDSQALLTFLWFGCETPYVFSDLFYGFAKMDSFCGEQLSFLSHKVDKDLRTLYHFYPYSPPLKPGVKLQRDPLNAKTYSYAPGTYLDEDENTLNTEEIIASVIELSEAPSQSWMYERPENPKGKLYKGIFPSYILGNTRPIWIYLPADYSAKGQPYKLLLLLDGQEYLELMYVTTVLDNLIATHSIAPTLAVMIGSGDQDRRNLELPCYHPFADFLAKELIPWIGDNYHVSKKPENVAIGGFSYGGLAALFTAFQHPEVCGNALSQSGSFWWSPEGADTPSWLVSRVSQCPHLPLKIYLDAGKLENQDYSGFPSILRINRALRDILKEKGYPLHYQEFNGGHDYFNWRGTLPDGLRFLLSQAADITAPLVAHVAEIGV